MRQMQDYAYPEYQAHVNDSVEYQVYNNSYPADTATQAVKDTTGQVVWYQGNVASTYYFSTSCGETTDMTKVYLCVEMSEIMKKICPGISGRRRYHQSEWQHFSVIMPVRIWEHWRV